VDVSPSPPSGAKPGGYYGQQRAELVALLPRPLGRVLDVGCGEGGAEAPLRAAGATWISGIELHPPSAARAALGYDEVVTGRAEESLGLVTGQFDTILLYDVLEHLAEPGTLLRRLGHVAAPGARAHVSVPNARHWTLLRDLAVRGTFGYTDAGHRDATHLRWFTRSDIATLLDENGWDVQRIDHGVLRPVSALAERITRGLTAELLVYQWSLLAVLGESAPEADR
jgi:2-polyprenyl-3-methyl-5-hydroxy-6-metoxy-1,4-benzoquinol methylase